jgi:hypothetical protein
MIKKTIRNKIMRIPSMLPGHDFLISKLCKEPVLVQIYCNITKHVVVFIYIQRL